MDVTTPLAPRVRRFGLLVGKKDVGHKDVQPKDMGQKNGVPQPAPTREFPLMSGEETTDPVPCASAVVRTPSDATWDSNGASVYCKRAVVNFSNSQGNLKPCNVKMPIADQQPCLERNRYARSIGAVHNLASRRGKIMERFVAHAPLNCTWNHGHWTRVSKITTSRG